MPSLLAKCAVSCDEAHFVAQLARTSGRNLCAVLGREASELSAEFAKRNGLLYNRHESAVNAKATALHIAAARSFKAVLLRGLVAVVAVDALVSMPRRGVQSSSAN